MEFLHKELTAKILGACFKVSNELGSGFEAGLLVNFDRPKLEYKRLEKNR